MLSLNFLFFRYLNLQSEYPFEVTWLFIYICNLFSLKFVTNNLITACFNSIFDTQTIKIIYTIKRINSIPFFSLAYLFFFIFT